MTMTPRVTIRLMRKICCSGFFSCWKHTFDSSRTSDPLHRHPPLPTGTGGVQQTTVAAAAAAAGAERGSGLPSNGLDSSGSGGPKLGGGMSEGPAGGSAGRAENRNHQHV
ncbi:hypothetical protein D4764_21G0008120 [Takifugu flavidus]|uniref:Uncharacterized protein n=1 Tax=Takifugu flavidus TaxID=433684 RepID=A0A5C6NEJ2_9TELE|nr:hypothetical protein D4764_21G0008120 [Takifugu flavidus]